MLVENTKDQNKNMEQNIKKLLKGILDDPRGQIRGQNQDDTADFDDGNEDDLCYRFKEVIQT